jgi:hypothetical protein
MKIHRTVAQFKTVSPGNYPQSYIVQEAEADIPTGSTIISVQTIPDRNWKPGLVLVNYILKES